MFLCGAFLGGFLLHGIHSAIKSRDDRRVAETEANESMLMLKRLRDGKTNDLIEVMEAQLDAAIVRMKAGSKNSSSYQTLKRASDYRKQFPRTPKHPGESDESVTKTLSEVEQVK